MGYRKINKKKLQKAIDATEEFLKNAKNKNEFTYYGLTVYGCEKRNLSEYKEIKEKDYYLELTKREKELYNAI